MKTIKTIKAWTPDGNAVARITEDDGIFTTAVTIDGDDYDSAESYTLPAAEAWADILISELGGVK